LVVAIFRHPTVQQMAVAVQALRTTEAGVQGSAIVEEGVI